MYTLGYFLLLAILLGAVMSVLNSVLDTIHLSDTVRKLPVIGTNLSLMMAILMVWALDARLLEEWGWSTDHRWMSYAATGAIVFGMIPVKDAVINAINKGLRA